VRTVFLLDRTAEEQRIADYALQVPTKLSMEPDAGAIKS
jgi:hypothetical protein